MMEKVVMVVGRGSSRGQSADMLRRDVDICIDTMA